MLAMVNVVDHRCVVAANPSIVMFSVCFEVLLCPGCGYNWLITASSILKWLHQFKSSDLAMVTCLTRVATYVSCSKTP